MRRPHLGSSPAAERPAEEPDWFGSGTAGALWVVAAPAGNDKKILW